MLCFLAWLFLKPASAPAELRTQKPVPLPPVMHMTLTEKAVGGKAVMAVGDVHGCLDELKDLVNRARALEHKVLFVFCGDMIDKGPHNVETLHFIRDELGQNALCVRGNHEENVIRLWLDHKAGKKIKKKKSWVKNLTEGDIRFMTDLPYTIRIPHLNAIFVHAGFDPFKPIIIQHPEVMTTVRSVVDSDWPNCYPTSGSGSPWVTHWQGPEHVYFGHDSRRGRQETPHATGLDTACLFGQYLTGRFLTGSRGYVHAPARKVYKQLDGSKKGGLLWT